MVPLIISNSPNLFSESSTDKYLNAAMMMMIPLKKPLLHPANLVPKFLI